VSAALCTRYYDCCAMSVGHQVFLVLCIVYYVLGIIIRSAVHWVLDLWVLGPCALDATSRWCMDNALVMLHHKFQP